MNPYMQVKGTDDSISEQIQEQLGISEEAALRVFYYMVNNQDILSKDEFIKILPRKGISSGLTFFNEKYYVNVKIATLLICALLLDIKFTSGVAATIISLAGIPTKSILKLNEKDGQKCILRETLKLKGKTADKYILEKFKGECPNNNLSTCKYRNGMRCSCSPELVEEILASLADNNVFIKDGYDRFKYCW